MRPGRLLGGALGVAVLATSAGCGSGEADVTVGLITKQEENPYWVTMRDVAQITADRDGVELVTATGTSDVDVDSQVAALEQMTADGVDGILIAPTDSEAVVPAVEAAREVGVVVIAVDTPTDPTDAVDAVFSTNNVEAGRLVGEFARAGVDELGTEPVVALLDLAPGIASGEERLEGFLAGFGVEEDDPVVVGRVDTEGDEDLARDAMAGLLADDPGINVVYTVNEPAAAGAVAALEDAGADLAQVVVVSVDGGCEAVRGLVRSGQVDATAQQYPENMAREGVLALAEAARGGEVPSGYLDTGVRLVARDAVPGVESESIEFGTRNCWG